MNVEEILIKLGFQTDAVGQGVRKIKSEIGGLASDIKSTLLGAIGVAAIGEMARQTLELGSHVDDLSKRLGISTTAVQQWDYALKQNGSSIESAAGFFEKLASNRDKALAGNEEMIEHFKALGISIDDLKTKRLEDIGGGIAKAFESGDPQQLIGSLRAVGGRGAGELVAAFRSGLTDLFAEAPIVAEGDIAALDETADRLQQIKMELTSGIAPILVFIVQQFKSFIEGFAGLTSAATGFVGGVWDKFKGMSAGGMIKSLMPGSAENLQLLGAGKEGMFAALDDFDKRVEEKEKVDAAKKERAKQGFKKVDLEETESKKDKALARKQREDERNEEIADAKERAGENKLQFAGEKTAIDELALSKARAAKDEELALKLEHELRLDNIALRKAEKEHAKDQAEFDKNLAESKRSIEEARAAPYMSTLKELANSAPWNPGTDFEKSQYAWRVAHGMTKMQQEGAPMAQAAQKAEEEAQRAFNEYGPKSREFIDAAKKAETLKKGLADAGWIKRDNSLESLNEKMAELVEKASNEGLIVQPVNAP